MINTHKAEFELALQQCATEPIHQLGNIQPHGAVLVVNSESQRRVLQVSQNLGEFVDVPADVSCGKPLAELLGETAKIQVEKLIQIAEKRNTATGVISVIHKNAHHDLPTHLYVSGEMFVIEIAHDEFLHQEEQLAQLLLNFNQSQLNSEIDSDIYKYLDSITTFVRTLTNYDSVKTYRFDSHWNGEVISQDRLSSAPSFIGMHFPASDIPEQARRLYTTNLVRVVVDIDATPVPMLPTLNPVTRKPLDMTYSALRSLSPIHIEYLRNIGIQASMTISLMQNGRLWGLIACHHMSPSLSSIVIREAAIFISRMASAKLSSFEAIEQQLKVDRVNSIVHRLLKSISTQTSDSLLHLLLPELQLLLEASGMIVVVEGKIYLNGEVPKLEEINELLRWLGSQAKSDIYHCDCLGEQFKPAIKYSKKVAGILTTPLSKEMRNCIIWVREERLLTVNWAGKYEEGFVQNSVGEYRLTPRKSFELWKEFWIGRSVPWTEVEIGLASTLALALPESLAQKSKIEEEQKKLREAHDYLRLTASVFSISQEAIIITDSDNNIMDVNLAFTNITGYSHEEVIGKNPKILSSGRHGKVFFVQMWETLKRNKSWRGEIWNRKKSGDDYPEMLSISLVCDEDGKVLRHVAVFSDISELKKHEEELTHVAHYDPLTGIPNRLLLADRMKQGISQTSRDQRMMAVCYLDLDGFKLINDTMGHEAGDKILVEVSKRIENTIRGGDTVARLGGDEFVILLLGIEKGEESHTTLERLLHAISEPIIVQKKAIRISASIGVSIYPIDNEHPDTLMRHADQAMYVAKESGKNRYHIYDMELDKRSRNQNAFVKSIRHAIDQNQFELHYQPKINLHTKELVGVEALIRWRHPDRGILPPSEFLRQIENTNLDIDLGEWVAKTAVAQMDQWRRNGLDIEVSINISAYHLESKDFVEKLKQILSRTPKMPANMLQIEVLETVALNDVSAVRAIIESCHKLGVSFALDDFGTGYSSLSYLNALPVDILKIDQSFVRDMLEDEGDKAIVAGVLALANAFHRKTVAEGIETAEHIQVLDGMGCDFGQGYGIAHPMPAKELLNWKSNYL